MKFVALQALLSCYVHHSCIIVHGVNKYNQLKKFMQVEVNKKCMKPILVAVTSGFRDLAPSFFLQIWPN